MKQVFLLCFTAIYLLQGMLVGGNKMDSKIITSTKEIHLPNFPGAYNPSIVKFNDQYLLTFRIATIDINKLKQSLIPIKKKNTK